MLCGVVDPGRGPPRWADAGHPRPLLVADGTSRFVAVPVGPPIGVVAGAEYAESQRRPARRRHAPALHRRPRRAAGRVDRRRLRPARRGRAAGSREPLADALFSVVRHAIPDGCDDDAALLGIRWRADAAGRRPSGVPGDAGRGHRRPDYVADALDGAPPDVVETVALLVSELATNSVRHAAAGFTLDIERGPIGSGSRCPTPVPGSPQMRSPDPVETSGRGLQIVEALSDEWGCAPAPDGAGKTVWFEVARRRGLTPEPTGGRGPAPSSPRHRSSVIRARST